jgi:hypothetical protein
VKIGFIWIEDFNYKDRLPSDRVLLNFRDFSWNVLKVDGVVDFDEDDVSDKYVLHIKNLS